MNKVVSIFGSLMGIIIIMGLIVPVIVKEGVSYVFNKNYRRWVMVHKSVDGHAKYFKLKEML